LSSLLGRGKKSLWTGQFVCAPCVGVTTFCLNWWDERKHSLIWTKDLYAGRRRFQLLSNSMGFNLVSIKMRKYSRLREKCRKDVYTKMYMNGHQAVFILFSLNCFNNVHKN